MNALPYLLTASLFLLLFYGYYYILLHRTTFFSLNRAYLLGSVVASLVLPLVPLPGGTADVLPVGTLTLPMFVVGSSTAGEATGWATANWFWLLYATGVGVLLIRLAVNLRAVHRLIGRGTTERQAGYVLVRLPDDNAPSFSFGRYLALNATDARTQPDALLCHERAHIRQHHTADILFIELVRATFWFNPVPWLYKRALQELHEFLADRAATGRAVLATAQPDYARQLVAYTLDVPVPALLTPFVSQSTLKQRIVMLHKPRSHRRALLGYVLVLPLAGCLFMCTQTDRDQPKTEAAQALEQANTRKPAAVNGEVFTMVQEAPEFPGGLKKLGEYLSQNLKYPAAAQKVNAQGRVFVNFIVTKDGDITDVNILKDVGFGTGEEAARVVAQMPRWIPAKQNGHVVNVRYNLPINFLLDETTGSAGTKPRSSLSDDGTAFLNQWKHFIVDGQEVSFKEFKQSFIEQLPTHFISNGHQIELKTK